ncbi:MAG: hypothetical protein Q4D96_09165 [Propionibacteriaceae bacterium]|nr:hypothetical protein [Propionibacteriaceae bacterium]
MGFTWEELDTLPGFDAQGFLDVRGSLGTLLTFGVYGSDPEALQQRYEQAQAVRAEISAASDRAYAAAGLVPMHDPTVDDTFALQLVLTHQGDLNKVLEDDQIDFEIARAFGFYREEFIRDEDGDRWESRFPTKEDMIWLAEEKEVLREDLIATGSLMLAEGEEARLLPALERKQETLQQQLSAARRMSPVEAQVWLGQAAASIQSLGTLDPSTPGVSELTGRARQLTGNEIRGMAERAWPADPYQQFMAVDRVQSSFWQSMNVLEGRHQGSHTEHRELHHAQRIDDPQRHLGLDQGRGIQH